VHLTSAALWTLAGRFAAIDSERKRNAARVGHAIALELDETLGSCFTRQVLADHLSANFADFEAGRLVGRNLRHRLPRLRHVFTAAWYQPLVMGVLHEMNAADIVSVDIQHGQQGPFQSMFVGMPRSEVVAQGVTPSESWVWGRRTQELMETQGGDHHDVHIIGYPFLLDTNIYRDLVSRDGAVPESDVLISLQGAHLDSPEEVPFDVIREILKAGLSVQLRQHPNHRLSRLSLTQIRREFSDGVVVSDPRLPFSVVVPSVRVNVSGFSSTTLEAASLGVPSLLWSSIAGQQYADLIDSGVVAVTRSFGDVVAYVETTGNVDFTPVRQYITPGDESLLTQIDRLT